MYVYVYTIEINISNIHHKIFEAWKTFFSNSYLGVLRLFLSYLGLAGGEPRPATLFGKKRVGTDFGTKNRAKKAIAFWTIFEETRIYEYLR